jgi:hypothetical protein
MPLVWNLPGTPTALQGQVFTASLGTAVAFSVGPAVAYTGLAIANPATSSLRPPVKLIPLRVTLAPTSAGASNVPFGLLKLTGQGTASNGGLSAFSGQLFTPGFLGTCASNGTAAAGAAAVGLGTSVVQIGGTFSVINGTAAGTGVNTLYWAEMCGVVVAGTSTIGGNLGPTDLSGFTTVMPGETLAIGADIAVTARASLTWLEVPLTAGI